MINYKPLTTETWQDLVILFGDRGACGGCWCMTWRLKNRDYEQYKGTGNKEKLLELVEANQPLGVLAYAGKIPVAWCSVSPRDSFIRLETSKLFKRPDNIPVWSITCLFIDKAYRRSGLSSDLINAACKFAFEKGAICIEAYPILPVKKEVPSVFAWIGFARSYEKAGFRVVSQPSETRLIVRKERA